MHKLLVIILIIFNITIFNRDLYAVEDVKTIKIYCDNFFAKQINKKLLGLNLNIPHSHYDTSVYYNNEISQRLNFGLMRWPAGFFANFYDWGNDHFNIKAFNYFQYKDEAWLKKFFNSYAIGNKKVGIDVIGVNSKKSANGFDIIFVLNLLMQDNLDEIIISLLRLQNQGVKIKYCELGNELYHIYYKNDKNILNNFINKAQNIIPELRKNFPNIKISVPIGGYPSWQDVRIWDMSISNANLDIDAVSFHPYPHQNKDEFVYINSISDKFIQNKFCSSISHIHTLFPNKQIWLSEWGIEGDSLGMRNKTMFGILYQADFMINMLREDSIELANYIGSFGKHFSLIDTAMNVPPFVTKADNSSLYLWQYLSEFFTIFTHTSQPEFFEISSFQELQVQCFWSRSTLGILAVNKSDDQKMLKLSNSKGALSGEMCSISDSNLNAVKRDLFSCASISDSVVTLKPFSVNFVYLSIP